MTTAPSIPGDSQKPLFMPLLTISKLNSLTPNKRKLILTQRQIDSDLAANQFKRRFAELSPPELSVSDNIRTFAAIYPNLREFLNKRGATIRLYSANRIV